jgi:hypothetical protein
MGSRSATQLLRLPVQLHGIRLGRTVDLLLAPSELRVLGFVVLCGDDSERFLVYATAEPRDVEIAVPSALLLLEHVDFYRRRSRSSRELLGSVVLSEGRELGELRDLLVGPGGMIESLVVEQDETLREVEAAGARIEAVSTV